ncbi:MULTISPECIES: T9SS type A sorting domain-containing protein [Maribacter]|uniref:T9SS type A sorting domain-containing protein n=2 Tax=Maribacter TaxID=252356 RepID=A0A5B2U0U5_9FLAO|nr:MULTISPECIES: T9SS type A sorting domain-containing protein [Maribacter]KAA2219595.1 T9SS type A sorting domain-containing protein [Maribacter flavus]MDC6404551.1 T9SS type A sorting domain-containing protein [Maribacter sp. PR66]MEE1971694.1 T9SS type A sorting domain-containing protein [Maribacter flavus]TLF46823.1 T9SS type A sorting domain-containing protein [Maribacter aurantiacus]
MKQLYLVIFFLFCAVGFGQSPKNQGDIEGFSMYPNPVTNGKVYITTANNSPKEIFIYDVFGTLILKTTILGKELSLNDMDAGVYVLRVFEKDKMATRKLIVK